MNTQIIHYDNKIVKQFGYATVIWGLVGFLVGVIIAIKLYAPDFLGFTPELSYGRLRPLHTNAVIFAFVGNAVFFGIYYSLQRLCKARLFSDTLSKVHFWGWQLIILLAAITLPLGFTSSKEYAELEWPIDILITVIWVVFGINMLGTIFKRRESHLYVAIWFYIATWVTVAVLHIINSLAIPVDFFKSYSVFAGVQDALVQWWYGHNAVAFFLTTPFLGIMYYFIPKAANRPIYSYRLSIIHFWSLIFIYIWAGPHHLLYTSLPGWAQSLGTVFSIMLIAPSWGGMLNGLLTLRGAWDTVRQDPVLKFMVVGVTAYGMATFEGPMMSIKAVNAITHYTDYTIGHVHLGALGWNGGLAFAMAYYIIPRIFKTKLYSIKLANVHFWLATLGLIFYVVSMYWGGIAQSLMWKQFTPDGSLMYPNFLETVTQIIPMYIIRSIGGTIYMIGAFVAAYNLYKTAASGTMEDNEPATVPADLEIHEDKSYWHRWIESRPKQLTFWSLIAILIGSVLELMPIGNVESNLVQYSRVKPYTPLEMEGRDLYIREGCVGCHSQMIRPFRSETERYGAYSKAPEFVYEHPFLWGSKRTGPDLHRLGGKYPDSWHYMHMKDPNSTSPGSIMPAYPWMYTDALDYSSIKDKLKAFQGMDVPYSDEEIQQAETHLLRQSKEIAKGFQEGGFDISHEKEIIALIAYLQRLGKDMNTNY